MTLAYCYRCKKRSKTTGKPKRLKPLKWDSDKKILAHCPHCQRLYSKWTLKQLKKVGKIDSIKVKSWEK